MDKKNISLLVSIIAIALTLLGCQPGESTARDEPSIRTEAAETIMVGVYQTAAYETVIAEVSLGTKISTPEPQKEINSTKEPSEPTPTENPNLILPGTYLVGTDIMPGIYRGEAGTGMMDSCYWERLKDLSGSIDSLISNDNSIGQFYIQVTETDHALQTNCELVPFETLPTPTGNFPSEIQPGTYIIGRDIKTGMYKGQTGTDIMDSCYWERIKDLSGSIDSLITNDNSIGQYYIQVAETDFALQTNCGLKLLEPLPTPLSNFPQVIQPGTYIVGTDIQIGTYKGQTGTDIMDSCYWERVKDLSGGFDSLITNDNSVGQFYIQVAATDFALKTACELERVGD